MQDIADELPISRPAVSRHLRCSRTRAWWSTAPRARAGSTGSTTKGIEAVQAYLEQVWGEAAARSGSRAENTE